MANKTPDPDMCTYCNGYIDPIGGDNALVYRGELFCSEEHAFAHVGARKERKRIVSTMRKHAAEFKDQREPYTGNGNIAAQVLNDCAASIEAREDGF